RPLSRRWTIVSAEQNVPDWKERGEVLAAVVRFTTVMNSMKLRARQNRRHIPHGNSKIRMDEDRPLSDGSGNQSALNRRERDQERHWNGDREHSNTILQPVMAEVRDRAKILLRVMQLMLLPQDGQRVLQAMMPVVKEVKDQHRDERHDQVPNRPRSWISCQPLV